jgi:hypothetical protein
MNEVTPRMKNTMKILEPKRCREPLPPVFPMRQQSRQRVPERISRAPRSQGRSHCPDIPKFRAIPLAPSTMSSPPTTRAINPRTIEPTERKFCFAAQCGGQVDRQLRCRRAEADDDSPDHQCGIPKRPATATSPLTRNRAPTRANTMPIKSNTLSIEFSCYAFAQTQSTHAWHASQ